MTTPAQQSVRAARIDPKLTLGEVALTVRNLDSTARFYQLVIGLRLLAHDGRRAVLGTSDGHPLVTLYHDPQAPTPPANATGLYHLAIAFPTRPDLARWLKHVATLGVRLGQNDHRTHEALYFDDPEGNGIEIYHDWPQEQWPMQDGKFTSFEGRPIDVQGLLGTLPADDAGWTGVPIGTRMGHVHLKMNDASATRAFYQGVMGFDITADGMGAVFAAAGGYHHHLGNNAWHSQGGSTPPQGALGLRHYTVELSSTQDLDAVIVRLRDAGVVVRETSAGQVTRDPAGNRVLLRAAPSTAQSALDALDDATTA